MLSTSHQSAYCDAAPAGWLLYSGFCFTRRIRLAPPNILAEPVYSLHVCLVVWIISSVTFSLNNCFWHGLYACQVLEPQASRLTRKCWFTVHYRKYSMHDSLLSYLDKYCLHVYNICMDRWFVFPFVFDFMPDDIHWFSDLFVHANLFVGGCWWGCCATHCPTFAISLISYTTFPMELVLGIVERFFFFVDFLVPKSHLDLLRMFQ